MTAAASTRSREPGSPYPLGATPDATGTNFAIFSGSATSVALCLIGDDGAEERIDLTEADGGVRHVRLPGVGPGQRYGYRVYGPYEPWNGTWFNPSKLLLDPYAKAFGGGILWGPELYGYASPQQTDVMSTADSAASTLLSTVVDPTFDWGEDRHPRTPYGETVVYEAHVRGLTMTHPEVPEALRGTFGGVAHDAIIGHLTALGVTAIELLPVQQFVHDEFLVKAGLRNYWGYNTIGFFAPHADYAAAGDQVRAFKAMVKALHAAGIEVLLDVVYNHTAEGSDLGPTLAFRGIDNAAYYRLVGGDPRHYVDFTGTGNSFDVRQPHTLQLVMDSLRYWITELHVDGFRFDLASELARGSEGVDRLSGFFEVIQQDPVISQAKLIAEPWDIGPGGYQVGGFPPLWTEWNGRYRDTVRDFWRGTPGALGDFATRFSGSADLYHHDDRRPTASVDFVTAHDGFTLLDLVSYNDKHNEANGEHNRDGTDDNRSWNSGAEGPTDDAAVLALRSRRQRSLLATLLLSQGVPMLLHGDELGRTQAGNNNGYAQDGPTTWIDWANVDVDLLAFTSHLVRLRREHPTFRRLTFLTGAFSARDGEDALPDVGWITPDGRLLTPDDWNAGRPAFAVYLNGAVAGGDDDFLLLFNAGSDPVEFLLHPRAAERAWSMEVDTADVLPGGPVIGTTVPVAGWAVVVLRSPNP